MSTVPAKVRRSRGVVASGVARFALDPLSSFLISSQATNAAAIATAITAPSRKLPDGPLRGSLTGPGTGVGSVIEISLLIDPVGAPHDLGHSGGIGKSKVFVEF